MIVFLTPRESVYTLDGTLARAEFAPLRDRVRVVSYEEFFDRLELQAGSCVFTALDQLTPTERILAARARRAIASAVPPALLLNEPGVTLERFELVRAASAAGRAGFRLFRATAPLRSFRYPVFVRCEHEHSGALSALIRSPLALQRALALAMLRGYRLRDLLVAEYLEAAGADGLYRKYAAFIVGDAVIPRCIEISRNWVTKDDDRILTEATVREEFDYVTTNPHEAWLRETFRMAGVGYGRADYTVINGVPQLWEINLAPTIGAGPGGRLRTTPRHAEQRAMMAPARNFFHRRLAEAVAEIDTATDAGRPIVVVATPRERRALRREAHHRDRVRSRRTVVRSVARPALVLARRVARLLRPGTAQ